MRFTVYGAAKPAGSKRAFMVGKKGGPRRIVVSDDNPKSKPWKQAVAQVAGEAMAGLAMLEGPLALSLRFVVPRPATHYGKNGLNKQGRGMPRPIRRPDVLKLARAVEDALTGIVWRDDAQIVDEVLRKEYGEPERVEVEVAQLPVKETSR